VMMFSPEKCRDRAAECLQWAESASSLRPRDIGFDVLEVENFLVDAFDLSRVDDAPIEDARLVARFFLGHAADPAPDAVAALRARTPEQDRGNQSTRRRPGIE
jgi:hypothetical protein